MLFNSILAGASYAAGKIVEAKKHVDASRVHNNKQKFIKDINERTVKDRDLIRLNFEGDVPGIKREHEKTADFFDKDKRLNAERRSFGQYR